MLECQFCRQRSFFYCDVCGRALCLNHMKSEGYGEVAGIYCSDHSSEPFNNIETTEPGLFDDTQLDLL